jgi:hypothetical protein
MADREFPLSLIIKAVDRATAPLRAINQKIQAATAPVRKLNNSFRALADEAGLPRLLKAFGGVGRAVADVGKEALGLGLKIVGMAAGGGLALYAMARGAMEAGDKLGMMAERVGLSVDTYAQLQFAAAQADVEAESFNGAMDKFNKNLGDAKKEGGALLAFLNDVSPALASQVKHAKNTEEALGLMTAAFEKLQDPAKIAALAAAAFGKGGAQMGQWLHGGTKAIEEQRKRFLELAGSQEKFAKNSDDLDMAAREAETALLGLRNAAAAELFPALTSIAKTVADLLAGQRGNLSAWARDAGAALSEWVKGGGIPRLLASMKDFATTLGTVVGWLGGLKGILVIVGTYLAASFLGSVAGLVSSLWTLGAAVFPMLLQAGALLLPLIGKLVAGFMALNLANPLFWIVALGAALAGVAYLVWKHWEPIKKFFSDLWDTIKSVMSWTPFSTPESARPALGAAAAAPGAGGLSMGSAHVKVDFENLPKGARVTADPKGTADLDLSMGYSLVGP